MAVSGIWFYGLSGAGKTHASKTLSMLVKQSFLIDGDVVRRFFSTDLGYSLSDRKIQIRRLLGIAKICLENGYFPIISSVVMDEEVFAECTNQTIEVVEVVRDFSELKNVRSLYETEINVVGKDIATDELETEKIENTGDKEFEEKIRDYARKKAIIQSNWSC